MVGWDADLLGYWKAEGFFDERMGDRGDLNLSRCVLLTGRFDWGKLLRAMGKLGFPGNLGHWQLAEIGEREINQSGR